MTDNKNLIAFAKEVFEKVGYPFEINNWEELANKFVGSLEKPERSEEEIEKMAEEYSDLVTVDQDYGQFIIMGYLAGYKANREKGYSSRGFLGFAEWKSSEGWYLVKNETLKTKIVRWVNVFPNTKIFTTSELFNEYLKQLGK